MPHDVHALPPVSCLTLSRRRLAYSRTQSIPPLFPAACCPSRWAWPSPPPSCLTTRLSRRCAATSWRHRCAAENRGPLLHGGAAQSVRTCMACHLPAVSTWQRPLPAHSLAGAARCCRRGQPPRLAGGPVPWHGPPCTTAGRARVGPWPPHHGWLFRPPHHIWLPPPHHHT